MNLKNSKTSSQPRSVATDLSATAEILSFATSKSTIGRVLLARSAKGVFAILIDDDDDELEADFVDNPAKDFISNSICAGRRSTGASGRSFARSLSAGR
jgi:AraC family transcriptional regulator of adaptative response/methylated-DNA-[protein]-cysteine methyltransferase